jgi:hypothetical protein
MTATSQSFKMPVIARPALPSAACSAIRMVRLGPSTPDVAKLCVVDGKILVNGGNAPGFVMSDIIARRYGPLLRGERIPGIRILRVNATGARADPVLGLGIATASNGIGTAEFRDLTWIGDSRFPAINSDDAWAAIALKGKDANDIGVFAIRNFDFQNLRMASGRYYTNLDGISTEAGYAGTISDGRVLNASDACLDLKGPVRVDNVYLSGCRQGLKLWHSQKHGLIQLGTNRFVGIIGKGQVGADRRIDIDVLIAVGDPKVPLFRAEDGPVTLHITQLVSKPNQVLNSPDSYPGARVIVDQRSYN